MRTSIMAVLIVAALVCAASPASAQDHGSASFVTGLSVSNGSAISNTLAALSPGLNDRINLAGRVAFNIAPGFQGVGEVGRIGNVLPPIATSVFAFSPVGLRASAFYFEGGVRAFLGSRSAVNPYVEATGGFSQLSMRVAGSDSTASDLIQLGLNLTSRTSPLAGLGGGVMLHAGPVTLDAGYRYKKIFTGDFVSTLLNGSQEVTSHQAVFGVGVRF